MTSNIKQRTKKGFSVGGAGGGVIGMK